MEGVLQKFADLKIHLEEIKSATNNFDDQFRIGVGGFGRVYKGEVSHSEGKSMVAIKRLDRRHGQGESEFLKEINTLSRYRHENLISLLGFCYQGGETLLVYELASHGSLDKHLDSPHLTWSQRIKICLDVAKGLSYLHDPRGTHQRLIHCDVKGGNILLDDQWNAKIADFGFSILGSANEQHSTIITLAAGTTGYIDPLYRTTHTLTKESDIYSFGVVLLEVLCGTVCCTLDSNGHVQEILVPTWIESYKQKKLNDIIYKNPNIQSLDQFSLETISDIAYRCLKESREDRPTMAEVVTELETALQGQEFSEGNPPVDYERMIKTATPLLNYRSKGELRKLLADGVFLNDGKTCFSLNKKGEHCEMISFPECLNPRPVQFFRRHDLGLQFQFQFLTIRSSRFSAGLYPIKSGILNTRLKTQHLSPGITYTINLVFKFRKPAWPRTQRDINLKYKLQGETKFSISHLAYKREDGWWIAEVYKFTSDGTTVDFEIQFNFDGLTHKIEAEGIEFRPLENALVKK